MRYLALILALLAVPTPAGVGLSVFVDGEFIGTLAGNGVEYHIGNGRVDITTAEGVFGCQQDRMFYDRFDL